MLTERSRRPQVFLGAAALALTLFGFSNEADIARIFALTSLGVALALFASAYGFRLVAAISASFLTVAGSLTLAVWLFHWMPAEPLRTILSPLGPVSGFDILLLGLALTASTGSSFRPARRLAIILAGTATASAAAGALSLHLIVLLSASRPAVTPALGAPEASTLVFLGLLVAAHGFLSDTDESSPSLVVPVLAGTSVVLAAATFAVLARAHQRAQIQRTAKVAVEGIGEQVQRGLYAHLLASHHAVDRQIRVRAETDAWEAELARRMHRFAGLEAVGHLETADRLRWIVPRDFATAAIYEHAGLLDWDRGSKASVYVFESIPLSSGLGFLVFERVPTRDGFRFAVFRYAPLLAELLHDSAKGYDVAILRDGVPLFERVSPSHEALRASWEEQIPLQWLGFSWTIATWPTAEALAAARAMTPLGAVATGSLFAFVLALAVYLAQTGRERASTLLDLNRELENQVAERRRAEEALMQAQKMDAIGRLAGGVAHDFNNFLTVVHGYTELVRPLVRGEAARRYIAEISKASQRASDLTQQLLAFSRRQTREVRAVDLGAIVRDVHGMLSRLIGENITLTLDTETAVIRADPAQIQQIVVNLAVNARDAMPNGGKLTISTARVDAAEARAPSMEVAGGRLAVLTVRDTGIGMSETTLGNIFEPFFTTKARGRGTGLGLSTVYGIVQQTGGVIEAASTPGEGTTLRVYFPLTDEPADDLAPIKAEETSPPDYAATVLLVEDDEAVRDWIEEVLATGGYRVLVAHDGEEALLELERSHAAIDVLVTDVIMPHLGGVSLSEILSERHPGLPILFISGYPDRDFQKERQTASTSYLGKPFTASTLLETMRTLLDVARV